MANLENTRLIFKATPSPVLVLLPNAPEFTIETVNDAYLKATHTVEADLVNRPLFEAFPGNPLVRKVKMGLNNYGNR